MSKFKKIGEVVLSWGENKDRRTAFCDLYDCIAFYKVVLPRDFSVPLSEITITLPPITIPAGARYMFKKEE